MAADHLQRLIKENKTQLDSGLSVLGIISDVHYRFDGGSESPWMSGVGQHFRHIIEFYVTFLSQYPRVNYDLRQRNQILETDRNAAADKINELKTALAPFEDRKRDEKITLYERDIPFDKNDNLVNSTLSRELRYLVEHTVHHYAIIAMFLKNFGYQVPYGFGVAQSTLEYEASEKNSR